MASPEEADDNIIDAPPMKPPRRVWCHPADEDRQRWVLSFDDAEMGCAEYDNEADARKAFAEAELHWNCHLFVSVPREPVKTAPESNLDKDDVANLMTNVRTLTRRVAALEDRVDELEDDD